MPSYPLAGLRVRLAITVAATFAFMLAGAAVALHAILGRMWRAEVDRSLIQTSQAAARLFASDRPEFETEQATVVHIISELVFGDRTIVALDSTGRKLAKSQTLAGGEEPDLWHVDLSTVTSEPVTLPTLTGSARVRSEPIGRGLYHLAIGISLVPLEDRLRDLSLVLSVGFLLCLGTGAAAAMVAARRALEPVTSMAAVADQVSDALGRGQLPQLSVGPSSIRDEVGRLQAAFGALLARLESAIALERATADQQRQFLADAAHELRTPVAILRNDVETTLKDPPEAVRDRAALGRLSIEVEHLGRLVGDLLLLARGESTDQGVSADAPVYLDDIVSRAVMRAGRHPAAAGRQITLGQFEAAGVRGDPILLERAVMALLENALIHAAPSDVEVSVGHEGSLAVVRVHDRGPLIAPESVDRIFDRFVRLRRDQPGSGLGLAIARWIAIGHGGTLQLKQDPSTRTKAFVLAIPGVDTSPSRESSAA